MVHSIHIILALCFVFVAILSVRCSELSKIGDTAYYVSNDEQTYVVADFSCRTNGMELAGFETEVEFLQFNETMNNWEIDNSQTYWLGGLRLKNGLWYWGSTKERFSYTTWSSNEPNCPSSQECCLIMGKSTSESRNWQAYNCCTEHLYICELIYM